MRFGITTTPRLLVILAAGLSLATAACPGSLSDIERFRIDAGDATAPPLPLDAEAPLDCPTVVPQILSTQCAACHSATAPQAELDLMTGDFRVRLRNKPAQGSSSNLLINTTNFEQSAVYTKTSASPPFNQAMPPGGQLLDEGRRACLLEYIKKTPAEVDAGSDASDPDIADAASE